MASTANAANESGVIRVMSFNIRYGTAKDGENHWDNRKQFVVDTINKFSPDLLGTQEALALQRDYLADQLEDYTLFAAGRDDGAEQGEMTAVAFRRDRFEKLDGGHFWLSETPDIPASKSWDSSLTRMVTWLELRDTKTPGNPVIRFYNTHFDHRGQIARFESARLIRQQISESPRSSHIILTGDFNAGEGSEPYDALFASKENRTLPLNDVYRAAHPRRSPHEGTFSGFRADQRAGDRIDWIAASADWSVQSSEIDYTSRDGNTPSDHFPVTAVLRFEN
jgi:endonuclease/exonuclease/phosphatase family metal-dependent hydrolase